MDRVARRDRHHAAGDDQGGEQVEGEGLDHDAMARRARRHPGESRGPAATPARRVSACAWIPAFAGNDGGELAGGHLGTARRLAVGGIGGKVGGERPFPFVAIGQQFRLVVEQFLPGLGRIFEIRPLDDGVDRAGFLAQAAIDALHHVDVVAGGAAAAVLAGLGLDGDGQRRAHRLAELAGDAALLAVGIAAKRMLAAEARAERVLLERIVDRRLGLEEIFQGQPVRLHELPEEEGLDPVGDHLNASKRVLASLPA